MFPGRRIRTVYATVDHVTNELVDDGFYTDLTFDDLREKGIPESVIGPLRLMTHDKDEDYMAYIGRIGTDPVATKVKLSDLRHNIDASRYCRPLNDYERKREEKYMKAEEYLKRYLEQPL